MFYHETEAINKHLLPKNPASDEQRDALWNDPYYGLSNTDNYEHWDKLLTVEQEDDLVAK